MTREGFLARLRGAQPAGRGWLAFCPAHEDRAKRSLSVGADGDRLLVKCFAGCSAEAITEALGLTLGDLFGGVAGSPRDAGPPGRIVTTYDYRDEAGTLLYQVVRYVPKDFRPRHPDPAHAGAWRYGLPPAIRRVVYRLPDLAEQRRVWVVEGERDADRLWSLGLAATTTQGGSAAWRDAYADQLVAAGADEVVCLPDHDVARYFLFRGGRGS